MYKQGNLNNKTTKLFNIFKRKREEKKRRREEEREKIKIMDKTRSYIYIYTLCSNHICKVQYGIFNYPWANSSSKCTNHNTLAIRFRLFRFEPKLTLFSALDDIVPAYDAISPF